MVQFLSLNTLLKTLLNTKTKAMVQFLNDRLASRHLNTRTKAIRDSFRLFSVQELGGWGGGVGGLVVSGL